MSKTEQQEFDLHITGMTCASCVSRVEKKLGKVAGVESASVNLATERARVVTNTKLNPQILRDAVIDAGYGAEIITDNKPQTETNHDAEKLRLMIAVILTIPFWVMMGSEFIGQHLMLPTLLQFGLASVVQLWLGARFYVSGYKAVKNLAGNMDLLVAIGTSAAYGLSVYLWLRGQPHLYFEASTTVITLVLLGKWLESKARRQTSQAISALQKLRPDTAKVLVNGVETDTAYEQIKVGDLVVVRSGERIAVDGVIAQGQCHVDESMLTGESKQASKAEGDTVIGGSINLDGLITVRTVKIGAEATLSRIIQLVENAQMNKPEIQRLVDKVSAIFVPVVLVIALITLVGWLLVGANWEQAILNMVAVLVIACPCALGLATPTAIMVGTGVAAKQGILIKDANALETAHRIKCVAFDKTGTLTEGKPKLLAFKAYAMDENSLLTLAASIEHASEHPLAKALMEQAESRNLTLQPVQETKVVAGNGLQARIGEQIFYLGKQRWMTELGLDTSPVAADVQAQEGATISLIAEESNGVKRIIGMLAFGDAIKPVASEAIRRLHALEIKTVLISGDNAQSAQLVANKLGIDTVYAEQSPETKSVLIGELKSTGETIAMVGDGINDAPALASADISFAMSSGTDVAMHTADVTLMRSNPSLVADAIDISQKTYSKIKQNLFWAFIYNLVGIPLAALGMLSPVVAGGAMALSSLSVVSNALLLQRWKPKKNTEQA